MTIEIIQSLSIVAVMDHGKPNVERVAIYVKESCYLSEYCLFLGMPGHDMPLAPVRDHMLWFGHAQVNEGDWIMVYTASGSTTITPVSEPTPQNPSPPRILNIHWGKDHTVFQNRAVSPMLIKIGALAVMAVQEPAYQGDPNRVQNRLF